MRFLRALQGRGISGFNSRGRCLAFKYEGHTVRICPAAVVARITRSRVDRLFSAEILHFREGVEMTKRHDFDPVLPYAAVFALSVFLISQPAFAQLPWMNSNLPPGTRTELLIQAMTLDQKIQQLATIPEPNADLAGCGFTRLGRHIRAIPSLAIPAFREVNGGNGVRGGDCLPEPTSTGLPSGTLGAATFNPALNFAWGAVIGQEARNFAHHVLLGPGFNLIRVPYTGRAQEYMSEDPYLAGAIATQQTKGIQSRGIQAMIKHYVGNDERGEILSDGRGPSGSVLEPCTNSICFRLRWGSGTAMPHLLCALTLTLTFTGCVKTRTR